MYKSLRYREYKKKGVIQLNQIVPILVTILIIAFVLGISVLAATEFRDQLTTNSPEYNAVNNTIGAMFNLSAQLPLFGTIVGLFIILGVIFLLVRGRVGR